MDHPQTFPCIPCAEAKPLLIGFGKQGGPWRGGPTQVPALHTFTAVQEALWGTFAEQGITQARLGPSISNGSNPWSQPLDPSFGGTIETTCLQPPLEGSPSLTSSLTRYLLLMDRKKILVSIISWEFYFPGLIHSLEGKQEPRDALQASGSD